MRRKRKQDEQIAINLVGRRLTTEGYQVSEDTTFTDSPDWVFSLNEKRIAAECRGINVEAVMRWGNSKEELQAGKCYEIIIPNEPHMWLYHAIIDKEKRAQDYLNKSKADELWLIAHSELPGDLPFFACDEQTLRLLKQAASFIDSSFSCIWFVHPECGAQRLWNRGEPRADFPSLDISKGYPMITNKQGRGTITKNGLTFSVGPENTIESIKLQPLDKRYKI